MLFHNVIICGLLLNAMAGGCAAELPVLIAADAAAEARITEVLIEMDRNYGGTLVTEPADPALDSAAFVQRYLRRFSQVTEDRHAYSYRCERLLARLSSFPGPLNDARLDADIWQAYQTYEQKLAGATTYREGDTINTLHNTRDVLWMYLGAQAATIWADAERKNVWLDRLLVEQATPQERQARIFAVLQLITAAKGAFDRRMFVQVNDTLKPPAADALRWFAEQLHVGCVVMGVDPATLPAPRIDTVNLSGRMTVIDEAPIIDQESWSQERKYFYASFFVPVGQRGRYTSVWIPVAPSTDGLFFFVSQGVLYVWPKAQLADAIPQVLEAAGLIDVDGRRALAKRMTTADMVVHVVRKNDAP